MCNACWHMLVYTQSYASCVQPSHLLLPLLVLCRLLAEGELSVKHVALDLDKHHLKGVQGSAVTAELEGWRHPAATSTTVRHNMRAKTWVTNSTCASFCTPHGAKDLPLEAAGRYPSR
jgi:hypothetical protein